MLEVIRMVENSVESFESKCFGVIGFRKVFIGF